MSFPKDCSARKIGSRGRQLVHSLIDTDHWEYHEESGNDFGRDCVIELSENGEWRNHKLEGQIKGTTNIQKICDGQFVSFSIETKTISYALETPIPFILFVADTINNVVYYQCVQDYFISNNELCKKLENQDTLTIRIPIEQTVTRNDHNLQELAKIRFYLEPRKGMQRISS